ncbi:hypothetical protein E2C01_038229 [Portunus trituberculatus]|uniref:Uncharacterized protein n=1 Tax=Portunus trituberculatus TaxID=210409 RepID=A0A5B7FJE2_PORTR|nr:hypothetical protein [Portunus trituberculatus]
MWFDDLSGSLLSGGNISFEYKTEGVEREEGGEAAQWAVAIVCVNMPFRPAGLILVPRPFPDASTLLTPLRWGRVSAEAACVAEVSLKTSVLQLMKLVEGRRGSAEAALAAAHTHHAPPF